MIALNGYELLTPATYLSKCFRCLGYRGGEVVLSDCYPIVAVCLI